MFGAISGIPAVIYGHSALKKLENLPEVGKNKRIIIAGLVLGYIGIIMTALVIFEIFLMGYHISEAKKGLKF
jgi:hypothetical protein